MLNVCFIIFQRYRVCVKHYMFNMNLPYVTVFGKFDPDATRLTYIVCHICDVVVESTSFSCKQPEAGGGGGGGGGGAHISYS